MVITKQLTIDLTNRGVPGIVDTVQMDINTRQVEIAMYAGGQPWTPADGVTGSVAFKKPDGRDGWYDTMPDKSKAITIAENIATAVLVPEMLTAPGDVIATVVFQDADLNQLSTFPFIVRVAPNPAVGSSISNSYYNLQNLEQINGAIGEIQRRLDAIEAAGLHDAVVSAGSTWSGQKIVDTLAPALSESGPVVVCTPVEGYPLGVVSQIAPVQEGEGNPYPAGGGKNLLYHTAKTKTEKGVTFTANADGTITVSGTATDDIFYYATTSFSLGLGEYILSGCPAGGGAASYRMWLYNGTVYYRDVGNSVAFTVTDGTLKWELVITIPANTTVDNLVFQPMLRSSDITDSTYAPYSNIRPITGHTAVTLTRCGKNLLSSDIQSRDNWFKEDASSSRLTFDIGELPEGTYTVSVSIADDYVADTYLYLKSRPAAAEAYTPENVNTVEGRAFMVQNESLSLKCTFIARKGERFQLWGLTSSTFDTVKSIQLEHGSVATSYEPYRGEEITLDLGQAVYGGSLDWKTGVLTVDRAIYNLSDFIWHYDLGNFYTRSLAGIGHDWDDGRNADPDCICSHYPVVGVDYVSKLDEDDVPKKDKALGYVSGYLYLHDSQYVDVDEDVIGSVLDGVQFCVPLKTSITVQLTPQEVLALSGTNTLYSDTGDTEVIGRADPHAVIENQMAIINSVLQRLSALETAAVNNT